VDNIGIPGLKEWCVGLQTYHYQSKASNKTIDWSSIFGQCKLIRYIVWGSRVSCTLNFAADRQLPFAHIGTTTREFPSQKTASFACRMREVLGADTTELDH